MRQKRIIFGICFFFQTVSILIAQTGGSFSGIQLNPVRSVLFGEDVVIHDSATQDQRTVAICSAFNGWLFSIYSYYDNNSEVPFFTIMKSIDSGLTWSIFRDIPIPYQFARITSTDIVAIGDSISNLKVIISCVAIEEGTNGPGAGTAYCYNGVTGQFVSTLFYDTRIFDIKLCTDFSYPAINSNPRSLGLLYSVKSDHEDSIVFLSSSNAGQSFDGRQIVATTSQEFRNVDLAYGRCQSYPTGRYYAVWEEKDQIGTAPGRIYTAHSDPNFNSPFTTPVRLDNLDIANTNLGRSPVISCQANDADNDSLNMTEVIFFEKWNNSAQKSNLVGYVNMKAATSSYFYPTTISDPSYNNLEPDITFNSFDTTFLMTYFDSTNLLLPVYSNSVNIINPDSWNLLSSGYNDNNNISQPAPKVGINMSEEKEMVIWSSDGSNNNGIAMFDADYALPSAIDQQNVSAYRDDAFVYPNPCKNSISLKFELFQTQNVSIRVYNQLGQQVKFLPEQKYGKGTHITKLDVSALVPGSYVLVLKSNESVASKKFMVMD